jgi:hypothetical protein
MARGKPLNEVLSEAELRAKRGAGAGVPPAAAYLPPPQQPDVLSKLWQVKGQALSLLRRVLLFTLVVAAALVAHSQEGLRVRIAALVGTGGSAGLVRAASTALPVSVVAAVVLAWCA